MCTLILISAERIQQRNTTYLTVFNDSDLVAEFSLYEIASKKWLAIMIKSEKYETLRMSEFKSFQFGFTLTIISHFLPFYSKPNIHWV